MFVAVVWTCVLVPLESAETVQQTFHLNGLAGGVLSGPEEQLPKLVEFIVKRFLLTGDLQPSGEVAGDLPTAVPSHPAINRHCASLTLRSEHGRHNEHRRYRSRLNEIRWRRRVPCRINS